MKYRDVIASSAAALILTACASAPPQSRLLAENFKAMQPTSGLSKEMSMEEAVRIRDGLVAELSASQGKVVGYKAGLTNPAVQKRFGTTSPVRRVLLEKMQLDDGAEVPVKFGAIPFFEADLVVVVKDEGKGFAAEQPGHQQQGEKASRSCCSAKEGRKKSLSCRASQPWRMYIGGGGPPGPGAPAEFRRGPRAPRSGWPGGGARRPDQAGRDAARGRLSGCGCGGA